MPEQPAQGGPEITELRRSSRDPEEVRRRLQSWLVRRLPAGSAPSVPEVHPTEATGVSTETLLFEARWTEDGRERSEQLVARVAPDRVDVPVFPTYDMERQFRVIRLVGEHSPVPVPRVWWLELDATALGTPFFVMGRVEGQVPPDVMPYNFGDSWLFDASPADRSRLQQSIVEVLAQLHGMDRPEETFAFLRYERSGSTALRRHVADRAAWYEFAAAGLHSALIERGLAWLDDHLPTDEGPTVLSWGDSRVGNVLFRDFAPVAVLDWEMAGLGPRELDLAWLVYSHRAFEDLAAEFALPGMPDFLRRDDVVAQYESITGHTPRHLDFYLTYAAVQWAIVFLRTGLRQVHFGEIEMPDDVDALLRNGEPLERMLAGKYWE
ncbi:MAG: phosphotransferase family protein [Actinobacteria bacterium]|nr:MAG: phosphotransferase family protein [Actinomycetota bacterium]